MRRTRFMSLFFLVLAAAFFLLPNFRQAFEFPLAEMIFRRGDLNYAAITRADFDRWYQEAEAAHDARGMAFVAIHVPDDAEAIRKADAAVAADPKLAWIYFSVASRTRSVAAASLDMARKLQAAEPDNAIGYLMEGSYWHEQPKKVNWILLDERAAQTEWRGAMGEGVGAPPFGGDLPHPFGL